MVWGKATDERFEVLVIGMEPDVRGKNYIYTEITVFGPLMQQTQGMSVVLIRLGVITRGPSGVCQPVLLAWRTYKYILLV